MSRKRLINYEIVDRSEFPESTEEIVDPMGSAFDPLLRDLTRDPRALAARIPEQNKDERTKIRSWLNTMAKKRGCRVETATDDEAVYVRLTI